MGALTVVFLANRGNLTKRLLNRRVKERLEKEPGCSHVQYKPSKIRRRSVGVEVNPDAFFGETYGASTANLDIHFWNLAGSDHEFYEIQWVEPQENVGIGWHQDKTHQSLGECHFQIDVNGTTHTREPAQFLDEHPLNVLETRLEQLKQLLPNLQRPAGGPPSLPQSGLPSP